MGQSQEAEFREMLQERRGSRVREWLAPGDRVQYMRYLDHGMIDEAIVIGYPPYGEDGRVVVIADSDHAGMPINASWLVKIDSGNPFLELRARYEKMAPGWMLPLEDEDEAGD